MQHNTQPRRGTTVIGPDAVVHSSSEFACRQQDTGSTEATITAHPAIHPDVRAAAESIFANPDIDLVTARFDEMTEGVVSVDVVYVEHDEYGELAFDVDGLQSAPDVVDWDAVEAAVGYNPYEIVSGQYAPTAADLADGFSVSRRDLL